MLRAQKVKAELSAAGLRFGIAAARYNLELADSLVNVCLATLEEAGADLRRSRVIRVPGSFEVTAAAARLAQSGREQPATPNTSRARSRTD